MINIDIESGKSKRLLTAGKYCPEDIVVTAEGGTQFTLTATTTPGATVTATLGDLIVTAVADASGTAVLTLPEGGTWTVVAEYEGEGSHTHEVDATTEYDIDLPLIVVSSVFNDNDWETVAYVSDNDDGENWWSIGDRKALPLTGTVGTLSLTDHIVYAFILDFNHNPEVEGNHRIHLQIGKTDVAGGKDIALCDNRYDSSVVLQNYFSMNSSSTNSGGWESSQMRTNICGTSLTNYEGTIIAVIPKALRNVLKPVTKHTNNTGNSTAASAVTATDDYFFLLSEYELAGTTTHSNANEKNKQRQYSYYAAGNSKSKYKHSATSTAVYWWLRSPRANASANFVYVNGDGSLNVAAGANYSLGFAPCFCV